MKKKTIGDFLKGERGSIRRRLYTLAAVSLASTLILGLTEVSMIRSTNSNEQLLSDIDNINLKQNENQTYEMTFLYNLEDSYNDKIMGNLTSMQEEAVHAGKYAGLKYSSEIKTVQQDIDNLLQNMTRLTSSYKERGFNEDAGMYASFIEPDTDIAAAFTMIAAESEWIDGKWANTNMGNWSTVRIDGKEYWHYSYKDNVPKKGQRDYLVARLGGNGSLYSGKVYISNVHFDNAAIDLSELTNEDLEKSYGNSYKNLELAEFDGKTCISYDAAFVDGSGDWEEVSVEIPIAKYDMNSASQVYFDVYAEKGSSTDIQICSAYTERFDLLAGLSNCNQEFEAYSKLVAEGADVTQQTQILQDALQGLLDASSAYSVDKDAVAAAVKGINKKLDALAQILTYDTNIISSKSAINQYNAELTELTSSVREGIAESTAHSRVTMTVLVLLILVVGALLVLSISYLVIRSVEQSIKNFQRTLGNIAEGDMTIQADTGNGNEFDQFGESLNQMTGHLSKTLCSVLHIASSLKHSGKSLEEMSKNSSSTSSQVDASVSEIAKGAEKQSRDVELSTEQIGHLGDLMDMMDNNIRELGKTSEDMKAASDQANVILKQLDDSNVRMTNGIYQISEQIETTNASVQNIKSAVSLISSIASETNMLALNASIEAARAGEAGKGFSVVASEVQSLADQSDQTADKIYEVINQLTADFQETMKVMQDVEQATQEQNEKLEESQKQFAIVQDGIRSSQEKSVLLQKSIAGCNDVRKRVSELMNNLSVLSEEYAASTAKTADGMQNLNSMIQTLLDEAEKLLEASSHLEQNMQQFTLD